MSDPKTPPDAASEASCPAHHGEELNALDGTRELTGRKVVLAMVAFAVGMIALLFVYWELYTRPFRPLQAAIAAEYPGSSPRAVGGRNKSHRDGSPPILRLIVRVDWDPREDESRAREMANHLGVISAENVTMTDYERFEVFLMHRRPEQWTVTWSLDAPVEGLPIPTADPLPEGVKIRVSEGVEGS